MHLLALIKESLIGSEKCAALVQSGNLSLYRIGASLRPAEISPIALLPILGEILRVSRPGRVLKSLLLISMHAFSYLQQKNQFLCLTDFLFFSQRASVWSAVTRHRFSSRRLVAAPSEKTRSASLAKKSGDESPHSKRWRADKKSKTITKYRLSNFIRLVF